MRKFSAAIIGLTLMASTLAACGSSGSDKAASDGDGASSSSTQPGGSDSGNGSDDFSELVADASKAKIKITYAQDGDESVTIAQDGEGKTAYGTDGGSTIYSDGDTTVLCDGTGSDATCTESPVGAGVGGSILTGFTAMFAGLSRLNSSAYGGHTSSDTIAGRDAKCITFKASDFAGLAALGGGDISDPSAEATVCVDEETGFLLKLEQKSDGSSKDVFLATEVGEPTDADLTPPATPQTIPTP